MAAARLLRPLTLRPFAAPLRLLVRPPTTFRPLTRRFHIPPARTPPTRTPPARVPPTRGSRPYTTRPPANNPPPPQPTESGGAGSLSLSQRLRKLSREYGWSALGVYLTLSVLDFPFCLLAIRLLGTERVGRWEHAAYETVKAWLRVPFPNMFPERARVESGGEAGGTAADEVEASIWTQLALAYAVHKSFIFVRVPLTAAVTPQVVKTLRRWGWDIGKRRPKN